MPPVPPGYQPKKQPQPQPSLYEEEEGEDPVLPVAPAKPQPKLEEKLIHVLLENLSTATVKAKLLQYLCVHKSRLQDDPSGGLYDVGHTTTQQYILRVNSEQTALRIARYLEEHAGKAFSLTRSEEIKKALPLWVMPWIKKVRQTEDWVDPVPYRKRYSS
jgi:hypothetical protein